MTYGFLDPSAVLIFPGTKNRTRIAGAVLLEWKTDFYFHLQCWEVLPFLPFSASGV